MAEFDTTVPVLACRPTSAPLRAELTRWVLWPALAWRVIVPQPKPRPFNPFQQAVLALCRAGVRGTGEMAERLCLPEDLVRFVALQLMEVGLLDEQGAPSVRAERLLDGDDDDDDDARPEAAGHVFVDALGGRLWPRFFAGALPAATARFEGGMAQVRPLGRREERATVLWPGQRLSTAAPAPDAIIGTLRQHARRVRAFAYETGNAADVPGFALDRRSCARVRRAGTVPEPVFVLTFVFTPVGGPAATWLVADPFGLGVSPTLHAEAARLARDEHPAILRIFADLVGDALSLAPVDVAALEAGLAERAAERVRHRLGDAAADLPSHVVDRLAEAEMRLQAALQSESPSPRSLDDALGHGWAALEALLLRLAILYAAPNLASPLDADADRNAELLSAVARKVGFDVPGPARGLLRLQRAPVLGLLERRSTAPLNIALAAALLAAERDPAHPLRSAARLFPGSIAFLSDLGLHRGWASHAGADPPSASSARALRDGIFRFVRALLGLPDAAAGAAPLDGDAWSARLQLRLRGRAEQVVAERFEGADARPELRARLVELHACAEHLRLLVESERTAAPRLASRTRDLVVAGSIALEAALGELVRSTPPPPPMPPGPPQAWLSETARALGFDGDERGEVPPAIARAATHRVEQAFRGRRTTVSATLIVLLRAAGVDAAHPLRRIAASAPAFLLDVARVVHARGHGGDVGIHHRDAHAFVTTIDATVLAIFSALDVPETA